MIDATGLDGTFDVRLTRTNDRAGGGAARAAPGEIYYCTAYGAWDRGSNVISGYVEYYDDSEDLNLSITGCVSSPNDSEYGCASGEGWDYACAETEWGVNWNGSWSVTGYPCYYSDGPDSDGIEDGEVDYPITVMIMPTGETINPTQAINNASNTSEQFIMTLTPGGWYYDGLTVSESFPNGANDACYNNCRRSDGDPQAGAPQPQSGQVGNNQYYDQIATFPGWVTYYEGVLSGTGNSCSWSFTQNVSYNGTQFVQHNDGVTISSNNDYATFRGRCSVDGKRGVANGCG